MKANSVLRSATIIFLFVLQTFFARGEASAGIFGPSNFDECVLDAMKGVTSDVAARAIYASCRNKFPENMASEKTIRELKDVVTICNVYWDGGKFQLGKTEGDKFRRWEISNYGVPLILLALPIEMLDMADASVKSPFRKDISDSDFMNAPFFQKNFPQVKALCKIE
jgi:hypothetical protein